MSLIGMSLLKRDCKKVANHKLSKCNGMTLFLKSNSMRHMFKVKTVNKLSMQTASQLIHDLKNWANGRRETSVWIANSRPTADIPSDQVLSIWLKRPNAREITIGKQKPRLINWQHSMKENAALRK